MKRRFNIATVIGLMALTAALTFAMMYFPLESRFNEQLAREKQNSDKYEKIDNLLKTIENDFVGEYDLETLMDGAAAGIISATGDRWSFYMSDAEYESYKQSVANEYVGIGVTVVYDEARAGLVVAKVHSGSPAEVAGLKYKDLIVGADGERVADIGYQGTVERVRGIAGTNVTLTVIPRDAEEETSVTVQRSAYKYNPISSEIIEGNIGLIRIENFDLNVDTNFVDALSKLLDAGVEGLVFDVRNNPGGLKTAMVNILDILCPEGNLITMRDKRGNELVDYSDAEEINLPMAVIVNEDSYSAAEFFAAALSEYGKAKIVGTGTSGKGYSQVTIELGDGSAINLSTNEYFTPNGNSLIGKGLKPDYHIESAPNVNILLLEHSEDEMLQTALNVVRIRISSESAA